VLQALGVAMAPADPLGSATDSGVGEERRPRARGGGVGRWAHEKAWLRFESEVGGPPPHCERHGKAFVVRDSSARTDAATWPLSSCA